MTVKQFVEKFEDVFLCSFSKKDKKKFKLTPKTGGYLWMAFNLGLLNCFEGDQAKFEFDKIDKKDAIEIQYDNCIMGDNCTFPIKDIHLSANDINDSGLFEFYVIGKDFSWCYVVTHEGDDAGPYFCYASR